MNYSDMLREMADYLQERPELDRLLGATETPTVTYYMPWAEDKTEALAEFSRLIRTLGGFDKRGDGYLEAIHSGDNFTVGVYCGGVCQRVPVVDDEGMPVMKKRMRYVEVEDELEPVYENKCPEGWLSF